MDLDCVLAGPIDNVLGKSGGGGLDTSCLAIGLAAAAIQFIRQESESRPDLTVMAERFESTLEDCRDQLQSLAETVPDPHRTLDLPQAAARYELPYVVDVGVADGIVTRGLKNTFRFGPGFGVIAKTALANLAAINDAAGKPAKTVMIVHEDSLFGSGLAKLLNAQLPPQGFEILETIPHPTPTRDFNNVVLKIKAQNPDLVIPANYYNEYVLLARTMQQQHVKPKGIYSVLGGAASSYKFVKEFPDAAKYIMDCNHWFDPAIRRRSR